MNTQQPSSVGRAGDPLPAFDNHMIRQLVTRHGAILPLPPASDLPGCSLAREHVGVVKVGTVRKWLAHKKRWDARFKTTKARVHKQRLRDMAVGYEVFGEGEVPPPSALAGRRKLGGAAGGEVDKGMKKRARGLGLSLWALWGSKHDEMTMQREQHAAKAPEMAAGSAAQGQGARAFSDLEKQERTTGEGKGVPSAGETSTNEAWRHLVGEGKAKRDGAAEGKSDLAPAGPVGSSSEADAKTAEQKTASLLSPGDALETNATGKRVFIGGLATPFSLRKEPDTASMITLATPMDQRSTRVSTADSSSVVAAPSVNDQEKQGTAEPGEQDEGKLYDGATTGTATPFMTPFLTPGSLLDRPGFERFVTAEEGIAKTTS